jgi:ABC-type transporter Mla MlaB component
MNMQHSLNITQTPLGKEGTLSLAGELTMTEMQETKSVLLEAIHEVDKLGLELSGVEMADISFIQLLCAAHRECFLSEKQIFIQEKVSEDLDKLLDRAGYIKQCGCFPAAMKSCLWSCRPNNS